MNMNKFCTSIEQSKKLAEFLPLESADMVYISNGYSMRVLPKEDEDANSYPQISVCWSLAALVGVIGVIPEVTLCTFKDRKWNAMVSHNDKMTYGDKDDPIDACYELLLKLHNQKLL